MKIPEGWPSNAWEQAVLLQCMAVEGCYNESNPAATLECLIDWHVRNAAPPAQEAEPVAWRRTERDICDEYYTAYHDEATAPAGRGWEPLYTRPDNDELRKAAEELIESFEEGRTIAIEIQNLRAALSKK